MERDLAGSGCSVSLGGCDMGRVLKPKAFWGRGDIYSVVISSLSGVGCDAYKIGQLQLAKIVKFGPEGTIYDKRKRRPEYVCLGVFRSSTPSSVLPWPHCKGV